MSSCREIEILLAEYAAEELAPAAVKQVTDHLAGCRPCRDELARENALRGALSSLPPARCPQRVTAAILRTIESAPTRCPWYRMPWNRPALTGLAAILALAVLLPLGWSHYPRSSPDARTYTREEIRAARRDATAALLLATRVIDRGERQAARQIGNSLPKTLTRTLKTITVSGEGGHG